MASHIALTRLKIPTLSREERARRKAERQEQREQERAYKRFLKQQEQEAAFFARMIPASLARMKIASVRTKDGKKQILNKVRIKPPVLVHEDYYMLEVDTVHLPYGIKLVDLMDDDVLATLSGACRTPVEYKYTPSHGFWYLIPRRGGLGIIPEIISYDDVLDLMPKSAPMWSIPIGVGENKRVTWIDLRKTPHMLILGSTGTGKSVFLKNLIFTLARNVSPNRLRFVVCDFKQGADFRSFDRLPHIGTPSPVRYDSNLDIDDNPDMLVVRKHGDYMDRVLYSLDDILDTLRWASREVDRRNKMFDDDTPDIDQWNYRHRRKPLPHIVVVIDEIGVIMNRLESGQRRQLTVQLADIAMLGRSAGIHLVMGLQKLTTKLLDGMITDNIDARIVGRAASGPQSATAMGNGSWAAARLPKIRGRVMWRDENTEVQLQTPFVSPRKAMELLDEIAEKWSTGIDSEEQLIMDMFAWCKAELNGMFDVAKIYHHFKKLNDDVRKSFVAQIGKDYEFDADEQSPVFTLNGEPHMLLPAIPGKRPRRVVSKMEYEARKLRAQQRKPVREQKPKVLPVDLFRYSLDELNGDFGTMKLYKHFKGKIGKGAIENISKEYEGKSFEINGVEYVLSPPSSASSPRMIVPVSHSPNPSDSAPINTSTYKQGLPEDEIPDWLESISDEI